ncbi:hypothetical protein ACS0TY_006639 [Phlomoides rotata]
MQFSQKLVDEKLCLTYTDGQSTYSLKEESKGHIFLRPDQIVHRRIMDGEKVFQFNHVFGPASTQDEVFSDTQALVRSVMDGYNVCIFAYGQTRFGKTHTMYGPPGDQMVEICNEQVRDILVEDSGAHKLEIRCCLSSNALALLDATLHPMKCTEDVMNFMEIGETNRAVGPTALNTRSSRSYSVLSVHVRSEDVTGTVLCSCLHLVDLAGSERVDKSEATGGGLKEAQQLAMQVPNVLPGPAITKSSVIGHLKNSNSKSALGKEMVHSISSREGIIRGLTESGTLFKVIERFGENTYKIELLDNYGVLATFNVADLSPYYGEENLGMSLLAVEASDTGTRTVSLEGPDSCGQDASSQSLIRSSGSFT